jgi:hypothetical protein
LFIIYIKDFLKFPLVCNIAVIISFGYLACDIITFFFIITLYFFISESLSANASTVLPLLIKLIISIKTFRSGLYSKEK